MPRRRPWRRFRSRCRCGGQRPQCGGRQLVSSRLRSRLRCRCGVFKDAGIDVKNLPEDFEAPSDPVELMDGRGTTVRIVKALEDRESGAGHSSGAGGYNFGMPVFYHCLAVRGLTLEHYGGPAERQYGRITLMWADVIIYCPMAHAWPFCIRCDRFLYPPHDHRASKKHTMARQHIHGMAQVDGMQDTRRWLRWRMDNSQKLETAGQVEREQGPFFSA